ncbi:hypothetical protein FHS55_003426 [Angulomicrobium tetraedrale]|uniref:Uncharacterized protein n=1 Tax=Ancylobacter tetraedralis TaxID=217068 RepID=A0A839ZDS7_9HYPH|nr:hypothetical protein [Ancylobacter tetraedralis]MBB3772805.1 hypothetical protein [Ancylobacter tetraedralis]
MPATGSLQIRIPKFLDGQNIAYGVPVRVRPVILGEDGSGFFRTDRSRKLIELLVPVGILQAGLTDPLPVGRYEVEAVLPSGEMLSEEAMVAADVITLIELHGEPSPNEWRSWAHFAGSRRPSSRRLAIEKIGRGITESGRAPFAVSIGTQMRTGLDGTTFDPASWADWHTYLRFRFNHRYDLSEGPDLHLDSAPRGIHTEREGGYGGLPERIRLIRKDYGRPPWEDRERLFVTVASAVGTRVFSLPDPWSADYAPPGGFFDIMAVEEEGQLICDPIFIDTQIGSLIAYMNAGQIQLAADVFKLARQFLFEKNEDPVRAAAGGYVLLSGNAPDKLGDWPQWLHNLATRFPHIPDGPILRARWLLEFGDGSEEQFRDAHDLLVEAVQRGIPLFTTGIVWLIEGLQRTSIDCPVCADMLGKIRGVARSMDLSQAFSSFSLAHPEGRKSAIRDPLFDLPQQTGIGDYETARVSQQFSADLERWSLSQETTPLLLPQYTR